MVNSNLVFACGLRLLLIATVAAYLLLVEAAKRLYRHALRLSCAGGASAL